jgi:hypothetical protein
MVDALDEIDHVGGGGLQGAQFPSLNPRRARRGPRRLVLNLGNSGLLSPVRMDNLLIAHI